MPVKLMLNSDDDVARAALSFAAHIARKTKRKLGVFSALPDPANAVIYTGPEGMMGYTAGLSEKVAEARDDLYKRIEALVMDYVAANEGTNQFITIDQMEGISPRIAYQETALADVIIFPAGANAAESGLSVAFDHLLMDVSLPILLAPPGEASFDAVVIAWDGSPEAAKAVRQHIELISLYETVVIAQNTSDLSKAKEGPHTDPAALGDWLSERGITSVIHTFEGKVAEGLIDAAQSHGASLIVSGAYGHSRAGEMLFGGATRGLLKHKPDVALALAH